MKTTSAKPYRPLLLGERPALKLEGQTLRDITSAGGLLLLIILVALAMLWLIFRAVQSAAPHFPTL